MEAKACALLLPLLALFAPTACAPADQLKRGAGESSVSANQPASSSNHASTAMIHGVTYVHPWEISGQWQLVGVTGAKVSPQSPIEMLINGSHVEAISRCVRFDFKGPFGQIGGMRARQSLAKAQSPENGTRSPPDCGRALNPVETAFAKIMRKIRLLQPRPGGRVAFVGNDGEAVFERPKVASELYYDDPWLMWGEWSVESMNPEGEAVHGWEGIRVLFKTSQIEAEASCKSWLRPYQQEGDRLTVQANPIRGCERDDYYKEQAFRQNHDGRCEDPAVLTHRKAACRKRRLGECAGTEQMSCYPPFASLGR